MNPRWKSNILAILAALALAAAGLWYLQSRPEPSECARWQKVVREQAKLLAAQEDKLAAEHRYYDDAALNYQESQPSGCAVPTREEPDSRF
jgi:hypothetical protein